MDPITQGVLGGLVAQTRSRPTQLARACCIGALAGMAPDLDILIRSPSDPLLALEYHRHFTHSLLFVPIGALLCSLLLMPLLANRWRLTFRQIYLWSLLGYGSHGLLDACTSYGTQLLWPLSDRRFAWDSISVIDPLFTLPLLILIVLAAARRQRRLVVLGLAWGCLYLGIGLVQHERALQLGHDLATTRGHQPLRLHAKPSFGNLAVWKVIYATEDRFHVSAVRPGLGENRIWTGDSVPRLDVDRDLGWLHPDSQQARDLQRFSWFSDHFVSLDRHHPQRIVDIRYSLLPDEIAPLWGIELSPDADAEEHVRYYARRTSDQHKNNTEALARLLEMIWH